MNMKDMIQRMTDLENEAKQQLTESRRIAECPPDMAEAPMPAPMDQGDPVRMNVNISAAGKEHVEDLLSMMKAAGLDNAEPMKPNMMPMRQDMERLRDIVDEPKMEDELEEYENEPDYEYSDHEKMTHDLSGGINRRKKSYSDAEDGDNAMAVEADEDDDDMKESIRSSLMKALSEKKAKPDFLDMDKDGDKKEPMKKAIKDKETKKKVDEVGLKFPRQDVKKAYEIYAKAKKKDMLGAEAEDMIVHYAVTKLGYSDEDADMLAQRAAIMHIDAVGESDKEKDDDLTNKLFKKKPGELDKLSKEKNRKMNQKRFMKPGKPSRSGEWGSYE